MKNECRKAVENLQINLKQNIKTIQPVPATVENYTALKIA
jgi:hypothetical protein